jgi:hypothetical protein
VNRRVAVQARRPAHSAIQPDRANASLVGQKRALSWPVVALGGSPESSATSLGCAGLPPSAGRLAWQRSFQRRKLELGECGRLVEIIANPRDRISEAKLNGWLGEVSGLETSLIEARRKPTALDRARDLHPTGPDPQEAVVQRDRPGPPVAAWRDRRGVRPAWRATGVARDRHGARPAWRATEKVRRPPDHAVGRGPASASRRPAHDVAWRQLAVGVTRTVGGTIARSLTQPPRGRSHSTIPASGFCWESGVTASRPVSAVLRGCGRWRGRPPPRGGVRPCR